MNLSYLLDFDIMHDNSNNPRLVEINPRMSGSISESYKKKFYLIDDLTSNRPKIRKRSLQKADILKTHGDNSLVKKITGIKKFTDTSIGLKNTVEWYIKNKDIIHHFKCKFQNNLLL